MRRTLFAVAVAIALMGAAAAEEPVQFASGKLKTAVEQALWVTDPTPTDMLGLVDLTCINYSGPDKGVDDLTGLEYAVNLESLDLRLNRITDASPLAGLTHLRYLCLSRNSVGDLSPLAGLVNLEYLDVHGNGISDISSLAGLTHMETLILRLNQVSDISPLGGLTALTNLVIWDNEISDISPLSSLTNLRELNLAQNEISDISPLAGLTSLTSLDLRANPWSDETCSVYIPLIRANNPGIDIQHHCGPFLVSVCAGPGGEVVQPDEEQSVRQYDESVRLEAKADPGFVFSNWSGTHYGTRNPDWIVVHDVHEIRANFTSTSTTLYVDGDIPQDPGSETPDTQENGTMGRPFHRIQDAVDVAMEGASIRVRPGLYRETVDLRDKSVRLRGMDCNDPNQTGWPVIDGAGRGPVVRLSSGGISSCAISGFVLTGGRNQLAGAVACSGSRLTLVNCLIAGNWGTYPTSAAVHCADSNVAMINCTVADNGVGSSGAAIYLQSSDLTLLNSILWSNTPRQIAVAGTSLCSVCYSDVAGGCPGLNNLAVDPLFARPGYWTIRNQPGVVAGPDEPNAVWAMGDYHVQSQAGRWDPQAQQWLVDKASSPCIDAGDPTHPPGHEPQPNGDAINLGTYGGTFEASRSKASP